MCDYENVEIVSIKKGDTLVFFVDTDYYDLEDIDQIMESVKSAFPSAKVLMLPDDMINDIKIFREEDILIETETELTNSGINKDLNKIKIDWTNIDNLEKWIND